MHVYYQTLNITRTRTRDAITSITNVTRAIEGALGICTAAVSMTVVCHGRAFINIYANGKSK